MSFFAVYDYLDATRMLDTRDSQYTWVISVTQTSLIAGFRLSALVVCMYTTLSFVTVHTVSIGLGCGQFPGHSSGTQWLPLKSVTSCMCMCSFGFSLSNSGSIHSSVKRNEIQTSTATARHAIPNHLARWLFHCGYNMLLVKTLTQWPPKVHAARYKLLCDAFVSS